MQEVEGRGKDTAWALEEPLQTEYPSFVAFVVGVAVVVVQYHD